jgi:hypothetical protein
MNVEELGVLLKRFPTVDLEGMSDYSLMKRVETKYLITFDDFIRFIQSCSGTYHVLEIESKKIHRYNSRYFDTSDLKLYRDHHNGKKNRYKVRIRKYETSSASFVELKRKLNTGETVKKRCSSEWKESLAKEDQTFLNKSIKLVDVDDLKLSLSNQYDRITLLDKESKERMTFDFNLKFFHIGKSENVEKFVIAELKQETRGVSALKRQMKKQGLRPASFSKYCTGIALMHPGVKKNYFKTNLRKIDKWSSIN